MREFSLITPEDLKKNYLAEIMPEIEKLNRHCVDVNFAKLIAIDNIYSMFHALGYSGNSFIEKCHLYGTLRYNIDDDGDISFVRATWQYYNEIMECIRPPEQCYTTNTNYFVMYGHHTELKDKMILDVATAHHSGGGNPKLLSYTACHVKWNFLDTLLDHQDVMETAKQFLVNDPADITPPYARDNAMMYFKTSRQAEKEYDKYIKNSEYKTKVEIKES